MRRCHCHYIKKQDNANGDVGNNNNNDEDGNDDDTKKNGKSFIVIVQEPTATMQL